MKLLFLTVMPSPYQRQLFGRMAESGDLQIAVRYYSVGAFDRQWQTPEFSPHEAVMPGRTLNLLGPSAHWNPGIRSVINSSPADLVIVSDYSAPTAQLAMRHLRKLGRPWIFWGEIPGIRARRSVGNTVRAFLQAPLRHASGIAAIGTEAVAAYQRLFPALPVFNIPYYCDLEPFSRAAAGAGHEGRGSIDLLYCGQLIDRKGVDLIVRSAVMLMERHPRLRLTLVGEGSQRADYERLVPARYNERVRFVGHVEPADLPRWFAQADIFCLPSRHDGWGVVINEALGAGLPVIASDAAGAARDLVEHGRNGYIVPAGDCYALEEVIDDLAGNDERRASFAAYSRTLAEQWSLDRGVEQWRHCAREILMDRRTA